MRRLWRQNPHGVPGCSSWTHNWKQPHEWTEKSTSNADLATASVECQNFQQWGPVQIYWYASFLKKTNWWLGGKLDYMGFHSGRAEICSNRNRHTFQVWLCLSCPQSLLQNHYLKLKECLIHWPGIHTALCQTRRPHDNDSNWLYYILHYPEALA